MLAKCVSQFAEFVTANEYVLVADLIETVLPCTPASLFVLKKDYKVVEGVQHTYGKWPDSFGNAFFIDQNYLLKDFADMVKQKVYEEYQR